MSLAAPEPPLVLREQDILETQMGMRLPEMHAFVQAEQQGRAVSARGAFAQQGLLAQQAANSPLYCSSAQRQWQAH